MRHRVCHLLAYNVLGLTTLRFSRYSQPGLSDHLYLYGHIDLSLLPLAAHVQPDRIKAQRAKTFAGVLNHSGPLEKAGI